MSLTPLQLCYWIQGFQEIGGLCPLTTQWQKIVEKVKSVDTQSNNTTRDTSMSPEMFITWLLGYIDLSDYASINQHQWDVILEHLNLVFTKVTKTDKVKTKSTGKSSEDTNEDIKKIIDELGKEKETLPPYKRPWEESAPWTIPGKPFDIHGPYCQSPEKGHFICSSQDELVRS